MDKLLDIQSYYQPEEPTARLLFDDGGMLTKEASAAEINEFVSHITPEEGFFYLHINAMGAGEYFGSNRNGDYFPEEQLIKWHKTFETSPAHVFRHHVNKDPAIAIGKVIYSYYNPRMHRVELVAKLDKTKAAAEYASIKRGVMPATSMACNTPFDVCSVCGNKAHTRQQYCEHLNSLINKMLPDGRKVMSLNLGPLKFFDISIVIKPADVTSSVLQKVANHSGVVSSVEAAESSGVSYDNRMVKSASIYKMAREKIAELIKNIEGDVLSHSDNLDTILNAVHDPSESIFDVLKMFTVEHVLNAFAEHQISPSVEFLAEYISRCVLKSETKNLGQTAIETLLAVGPGSIPYELCDKVILDNVGEITPNPMLSSLIGRFAATSSLKYEQVEKRAVYVAMPEPTHHSGYTNWQPGRVIPTAPVQPPVEVPHSGLTKLLLTIAGSALLAKYMINSLIEAKLRKADVNLTKQASITIKLLESSAELPFIRK